MKTQFKKDLELKHKIILTIFLIIEYLTVFPLYFIVLIFAVIYDILLDIKNKIIGIPNEMINIIKLTRFLQWPLCRNYINKFISKK